MRAGTWLRRFHPAPEGGPRLVCFPHAGGAASSFFRTSQALHPVAEVLAVQYPGRQDRHSQDAVTDLGRLADRAAEALAEEEPRPLVLFGHSMGALVAFEVARRIEAADGDLGALVVSGRRAPTLPRGDRPPLHLLDDDSLVAELRETRGTDSQLLDDREFLALILPVLRADYRAVEGYRYSPGAPLRTPVLALTGQDDPQVAPDEAQAWAGLTTGGFAFRLFPGGHFYLDEHSDAVAAELRGRLLAAGDRNNTAGPGATHRDPDPPDRSGGSGSGRTGQLRGMGAR